MATAKDYLKTVTFMRQQGMDDNEIRQAGPKLAEALDRLNSESKDVRPKPAPRGSGPSALPARPKLSL